MSLLLLGEGKARWQGEWLPAKEALKKAGLTPITLAAKEGLALLNGTQASTAFALRGLFEAEDLFASAVVCGALTTEAVLGSRRPFDARIHEVRGQRGQIDAAAMYRHGVIRVTDRHRAEGISVIAVAEGEETLARFTFSVPVLQRHFHRHFDGHGAGIRQEHALQRIGGHRHQATAKVNRRLMGDPAEHHVRHLVNLRFHCGIQTRVVVPVNGRPPGGHPVNQRFAAGEMQFTPVS
jgi:Histidine ammonia-lyase